MSLLQPVRGTHDLLPPAFGLHKHIIDLAQKVSENYGFQAMSTPIFEFTSTFSRHLGETSDIVTKEMYTFQDRSQDYITLRPEGTAGVARAFISHGLSQSTPVQFFYSGPMFRFERPQKGRLRQFHQLGVEWLGAQDIWSDIQVISCGHHLLKSLGLSANTTLHLNTLGDQESRSSYRHALVAYFQQYQKDLSPDSQERLKRNPLRILDSKSPQDQKIIQDAPAFSDFLNSQSLAFFENLQSHLHDLDIPFIHNQKLVRGLDYYTHTCFEFQTNDLGSQGTILAGGRYDHLIKTMGGPQTSGVGFAAGIERLALLLKDTHLPTPRPVIIIPVGQEYESACMKMAQSLRYKGIYVHVLTCGSMKKRMKKADKLNGSFALLLGEEEHKNNHFILRNLDDSTQQEIPTNKVIEFLNTLSISEKRDLK